MSLQDEQTQDQLLERKCVLSAKIEAIRSELNRALPVETENRTYVLGNTELLNALMDRALFELRRVDKALLSHRGSGFISITCRSQRR